MYNYSGIWFRIWGVCGIILLLPIVSWLFHCPWKKKVRIQGMKTEIIAVIGVIVLTLYYLSRIVFPNVASYTGAFESSYRDSSVAPPLPVTYGYCFWNGEGKKPIFYLDIYSKRKIFPEEFKEAQEYTIYYDKLTKIIVKVDMVA